MPTEEQIRRWELLELLVQMGDYYNYLTSRLLLDQDHENWLQARQTDTASTQYQATGEPDSSGPIYQAVETGSGHLVERPTESLLEQVSYHVLKFRQ
jgi:hypothetical protein